MLLGAVCLLGALACGHVGSGGPAGQHRAEALADGAIKALGGRRVLASPRILTFDFVIENAGRSVVRRTHTWDRATGRYRLEGIAENGLEFVTLFNLNTRQGQAFSGKTTTKEQLRPVPDPRQPLEAAYRDFQSDTAWLLGIFRLRDPGVELAYAGQELLGGRPFDVLSATASGPALGTLPGRQNWVYLDSGTGRPFAWATVPEGQQARVTYLISHWQTVDKWTLPTRLDRLGSPWSIRFANLLGMVSIVDNVFDSVSAPLVRKNVKPIEPGQPVPSAFGQ